MAKIFRPDGPSGGGICDPRPAPGGLSLEVEGVEPLVMAYADMTHRVGGYEGSWIIVESAALPGVELWLVPAEVIRLAGPAGDVPAEERHVFKGMLTGHAEEGQKRRVKRSIAAAAVVAVLVWMVTGGFTGLVLAFIPRSLEVALGETLAAGVVEENEPCTDPELVGAVEEVLVRLVEGMDDPPYEFRVRVIQSEDINAFALPGGEIFFHSALLEKSESVHEVAAVMGHEVQHVLQRHGMRGIVRSAGISVGLRVLLGDAGEGVASLANAAGGLTNLKFGRDQERESDTEGVALMVRAGFDPDGAVRFFGMLAEQMGDTGSAADRLMAMASTHPASSERTERLRELAAASRPPKSVDLGVDWSALRGRCSGTSEAGGPATEATDG